MRKITLGDVRPGALLARDVYSWQGKLLLETGKALDEARLDLLKRQRVTGIVIQDWRVDDVVIVPSIPEDVETEAATYLRRMVQQNRGRAAADVDLEIATADRLVKVMVQELLGTFLGDVNLDGGRSAADYDYIHSVKMTALSLLIGKELGLAHEGLVKLGIAALLADVGFLLVPPGVLARRGDLGGAELETFRAHPTCSRQILDAQPHVSPEIIDAVAGHHERSDGSGYPNRLSAEMIPPMARIIAVADTYHELISLRPGGQPLLPARAADFIAERNGREFDRATVAVFLKTVPLYSKGTVVALSDGEIGVVTNAAIGRVKPPVVRICCDRHGREPRRLYDIDLAKDAHRDQEIIAIDIMLPETADEITEEPEDNASLMQSTASPPETPGYQVEKTHIPIFAEAHIKVDKVKDWHQAGAAAADAPPPVHARQEAAPEPAPRPEPVAAAANPGRAAVNPPPAPKAVRAAAERKTTVSSPEGAAQPPPAGSRIIRTRSTHTQRQTRRVVRRRTHR